MVLITGASAGIGEAVAWRFAELGCKLVLVARREEKLAALREALQKERPGCQVHTVAMDVREWGRVEKLPSEIPAAFADVAVLVLNAGLALGVAPGHETDPLDIHAMIDTNVTSLMYFVRSFTPGMVQRREGHIISISSIAGQEAYAGGSE